VAKAKAVLKAAGVATPVALDLWWTPSHYGDASADEYAEIQRALNGSGLFKVTLKSAEWAQYSAQPGKRYNAFQLGWFPDYPDAEDYIVPFYQPDNFMANGYTQAMNRADQEGYGAKRPPPAAASGRLRSCGQGGRSYYWWGRVAVSGAT
jgi:peptide/nickel transport system substrate-binding protein